MKSLVVGDGIDTLELLKESRTLRLHCQSQSAIKIDGND